MERAVAIFVRYRGIRVGHVPVIGDAPDLKLFSIAFIYGPMPSTLMNARREFTIVA
jgi:hypothetical protein